MYSSLWKPPLILFLLDPTFFTCFKLALLKSVPWLDLTRLEIIWLDLICKKRWNPCFGAAAAISLSKCLLLAKLNLRQIHSATKNHTIFVWCWADESRWTGVDYVHCDARRFTVECAMDIEWRRNWIVAWDSNWNTWQTYPCIDDWIVEGKTCRQLHVHCSECGWHRRTFVRIDREWLAMWTSYTIAS